mmetsp:Transcript_9833/g.30095  ORF Transcript_9833/g.30095 Transcript_9833/m.30095 type:complete len:217 (-) Transcript_9833:1203-1853(-)
MSRSRWRGSTTKRVFSLARSSCPTSATSQCSCWRLGWPLDSAQPLIDLRTRRQCSRRRQRRRSAGSSYGRTTLSKLKLRQRQRRRRLLRLRWKPSQILKSNASTLCSPRSSTALASTRTWPQTTRSPVCRRSLQQSVRARRLQRPLNLKLALSFVRASRRTTAGIALRCSSATRVTTLSSSSITATPTSWPLHACGRLTRALRHPSFRHRLAFHPN